MKTDNNNDLHPADSRINLRGTHFLISVSWETNKVLDGDVMAFMLDENGTIPRRYDIVFYNLQHHRSKSVIHRGDDKRHIPGQEHIEVIGELLPQYFFEIAFVLSIFDADENDMHLNSLESLIVSVEELETREIRYKSKISNFSSGMNAVEVGRLQRNGEHWSFLGKCKESEKYKAVHLSENYGLYKWKE